MNYSLGFRYHMLGSFGGASSAIEWLILYLLVYLASSHAMYFTRYVLIVCVARSAGRWNDVAHVATCMAIGDWFLLRQISKVWTINQSYILFSRTWRKDICMSWTTRRKFGQLEHQLPILLILICVERGRGNVCQSHFQAGRGQRHQACERWLLTKRKYCTTVVLTYVPYQNISLNNSVLYSFLYTIYTYHVWIDLGLNKNRDWFLNFFAGPIFLFFI